MSGILFALALGAGVGGDIDIVGTGNHQAVLFIVLLVGALAAIACSFVNIFSKACDSKIISFAIDFAMTVACAIIYITTIYRVDYGVVRVYSALAFLLAVIIVEHYSEKLILKTQDRVKKAIKKLFSYIAKMLKLKEKKEKREKKQVEKIVKLKAKNEEKKAHKVLRKKEKEIKRQKAKREREKARDARKKDRETRTKDKKIVKNDAKKAIVKNKKSKIKIKSNKSLKRT